MSEDEPSRRDMAVDLGGGWYTFPEWGEGEFIGWVLVDPDGDTEAWFDTLDEVREAVPRASA